MKQTSTQRVRASLRLCLGLFLTTFSLMFSKTSTAHNIIYFTPPCFLQRAAHSTTFTVPVFVANAGSGSYFHWQYKPAGATTWTYFSGNNSTITVGGKTFSVSNASFALVGNA